MKMLKHVAALALISSIAVAQAQTPQNRPGPESLTGKAMPKFTMKDLSGKAVTNASLKGKVVIFDFWATWCGPCKAASPLMQDLHKKYAKKGLVVVGANVMDPAPNGAKNYSKEHGYNYLFTTGGDDLARSIGITGIPCFVFMDKKGIVQKVQIGYGDELKIQFEDTVRSLLAH